MEKIILKDRTELEILEGATLSKVTVQLTSAEKVINLFELLSNKGNLSLVQFISGEAVTAEYENMMLLEPHFAVTKKDGVFDVAFGFRELTTEEKNQDAVSVAISYLSDEQALSVPLLFKEWLADGAFKAGDRYRRNGILYKCLQDHNGQDDWAPEAASSLWTKVLIQDTETIAEWEQPESTNPYAAGDKVTHNGATWVSNVDNNVWEPGVYGWTQVA